MLIGVWPAVCCRAGVEHYWTLPVHARIASQYLKPLLPRQLASGRTKPAPPPTPAYMADSLDIPAPLSMDVV